MIVFIVLLIIFLKQLREGSRVRLNGDVPVRLGDRHTYITHENGMFSVVAAALDDDRISARHNLSEPVKYLHGYLNENAEIPKISLETVFRAAQRVESMRKKKMKVRSTRPEES